jgi:LysR family transcriptional regulator, regulator for bpeEF and oprC
MDRMRALQYFIAAAKGGSLSAAARELEVSVPAVAKLVNALERDLGVALLERSATGLKLTTAGEAYLASCRPMVEALVELDEQTRGATTRPRGTVVIGIQHIVAKLLLAPSLGRFHARHPEISLDLRDVTQITGPDADGIDIYLSFAWPKVQDMVHKPLGSARFTICAAPSYWARHGMPSHPADLRDHDCLMIRTQLGTVMDIWGFTRGNERHDVKVNGWFVCSNPHRDVALQLALEGQGVLRKLDWADREKIETGALVQALDDWECADAPQVVMSHRPSARRTARVRLAMAFIEEALREAAAPRRSIERAPAWAGTKGTRASRLVKR